MKKDKNAPQPEDESDRLNFRAGDELKAAINTLCSLTNRSMSDVLRIVLSREIPRLIEKQLELRRRNQDDLDPISTDVLNEMGGHQSKASKYYEELKKVPLEHQSEITRAIIRRSKDKPGSK